MVGMQLRLVRLGMVLLCLFAVVTVSHEHGHAHTHTHGDANPASKYSREANEGVDSVHAHAHSDEPDESDDMEVEAPAGGCGCGGHAHAHDDQESEVDTDAHSHEEHDHSHGHGHAHGEANPAGKYSREVNEAVGSVHGRVHSGDEPVESGEMKDEAPAGGCGCGGHGHAHDDHKSEAAMHAHSHEEYDNFHEHGHAHGEANLVGKCSSEVNEAVDSVHAHAHSDEPGESYDKDVEAPTGGCGCGSHAHAHDDHERETDSYSHEDEEHDHSHEHGHAHGDAKPAGKYSSEANEASEHDDHVAGEHGHAHRASDNAQAHDHAHSHDHGHAHESHGDDSHGHSYGEGGCGCGHSHGMDGSGTLWDDIVHEVTDMCPWLIIGLVVAVLLQVLPIIPSDLSVYLGGRTRAGSFGLLDAFFASVRGAVVGLCVPLCSCGVLPFAVLLAKQGCSPAVVTAFVTASQSAGLDSAVVTYGVLGPTATAARLVGALCLAIAGGIAATSFAGKPAKPASKDTVALAAKSKGACKAGEKDVQTKSEADEKAVHDHADGEGQGHAHGKEASKDTGSNWVGDDSVDECCDFDSEADTEPKSLFYRVFINPFKLLLSTFEEIVPWLGFGLVLSCVCTRYVREPAADAYLAITEHVGENSPVVQEAVAVLMRGAVLAATIPLQLCEHATVTFTRALKQAGASNGLAFGFLSLTPSVNVATLGVLLKGFPASTAETSGMRVVRVCVALVSTAVLLSLAVDHWDIEVMPEADAAEEHLPAWLVDGFLMAAGVLSVASVVRRMFF